MHRRGGCRGPRCAFFSALATSHRPDLVGVTDHFPCSSLLAFVLTSLSRHFTPAGSEKQSARAAGTSQRNPATVSMANTFCSAIAFRAPLQRLQRFPPALPP